MQKRDMSREGKWDVWSPDCMKKPHTLFSLSNFSNFSSLKSEVTYSFFKENPTKEE